MTALQSTVYAMRQSVGVALSRISTCGSGDGCGIGARRVLNAAKVALGSDANAIVLGGINLVGLCDLKCAKGRQSDNVTSIEKGQFGRKNKIYGNLFLY